MEIDDNKIFKIALITTLVGLVGLMVFSTFISPKEVTIDEINKGMVEEQVTIIGIIESVEKSNSNSYFLKINDGTGKLSVIIFESTTIELEELGTPPEIFLHEKVKITGTLTEYKSNMEIIISTGNSIKILV